VREKLKDTIFKLNDVRMKNNDKMQVMSSIIKKCRKLINKIQHFI